MADPRSPAQVLVDELEVLRAVPTMRTPLLRALAPLADVASPEVRLAVARVYATLPLDPTEAAGPRTLDAVQELLAELGLAA